MDARAQRWVAFIYFYLHYVDGTLSLIYWMSLWPDWCFPPSFILMDRRQLERASASGMGRAILMSFLCVPPPFPSCFLLIIIICTAAAAQCKRSMFQAFF